MRRRSLGRAVIAPVLSMLAVGCTAGGSSTSATQSAPATPSSASVTVAAPTTPPSSDITTSAPTTVVAPPTLATNPPVRPLPPTPPGFARPDTVNARYTVAFPTTWNVIDLDRATAALQPGGDHFGLSQAQLNGLPDLLAYFGSLLVLHRPGVSCLTQPTSSDSPVNITDVERLTARAQADTGLKGITVRPVTVDGGVGVRFDAVLTENPKVQVRGVLLAALGHLTELSCQLSPSASKQDAAAVETVLSSFAPH